jgi:Autoinducer binding domain
MAESLEYGRIAFEFAEEVDRFSDPDEVWNAMRRIISPFGLELYGFFARVPGPRERLDTIAFNKQIPELGEWLKLYDDGRYAEVDPVMRRLRHPVRSFAHHEVCYELDPRALELKQRRRDFGFGNGFSIPIFGSTGANGFMSYGIKGLKPDLPTHKKRTLHLITLYAADRICSLRSAQSAPNRSSQIASGKCLPGLPRAKPRGRWAKYSTFPPGLSRSTRNRHYKGSGL